MLNVLSTMARIDAKPGKPALKNTQAAPGIVTGYMTMESPQAKGSMAISFSKSAIIGITQNMLGETHEEIDDAIKDMTGELANMAVGGAKNILIEQGYDFDMSLPSVFIGDDHEIKHLEEGAPTIIMPFDTDSGKFYIEVCFTE